MKWGSLTRDKKLSSSNKIAILLPPIDNYLLYLDAFKARGAKQRIEIAFSLDGISTIFLSPFVNEHLLGGGNFLVKEW